MTSTLLALSLRTALALQIAMPIILLVMVFALGIASDMKVAGLRARLRAGVE